MAKNILNISESELEELKEAYQSAVKSALVESQNRLDVIYAALSELDEQKKASSDVYVKMEINEKQQKLRKEINFHKNTVAAISNAGDLTSFTDLRDIRHENIPSFINVKTDRITFDEETILSDEIPSYVPYINEETFRTKGYVFDSIRIAPNTYILATNGYNEGVSKSDGKYQHPSDVEQGYVILTLDQLVLVNDYYYTKARAVKVKEANEKNQRNEAYYDKLTVERRQSFLNQKNYYYSLPKSVQKKISQQDYEALPLEGKEALYKPFKRYNPEKLKNKLESTQMWVSFHSMYERFLNPKALPLDKNKNEIPIDKPRINVFGSPEVFSYWFDFVDMMKWKLKDIKVQREVESEQRKIAMETSFGDSNTNLELKDKYGILVKRQNGTQILPNEINQIKESWNKVQQLFGGLSKIASTDNLKISHTADKFVYASRASGMYIPTMKTIAVTNKYGNSLFQCIMAHETAHYIDNRIGEQKGQRYSTDDFESTSGIIARVFRKNMNKASDSDYTNATIECFARAMEQYFAIEVFGEDAAHYVSKELGELKYVDSDTYVSKANYENSIKPLILKLLSEEKDFFEYLVELENEATPVVVKVKETSVLKSEKGDPKDSEEYAERSEWTDAISTLEMLIESGGDEKELAEWKDAVETLRMLL